jgi:hypothetical protein
MVPSAKVSFEGCIAFTAGVKAVSIVKHGFGSGIAICENGTSQKFPK